MEKVNTEKWAFIINPISGNDFAGKYFSALQEIIRLRGIDAEFEFTKAKGHATELAEQCYKKGIRNIVAVGGDGTINEIARTLINKPDAVLGVVPAGTGNDTIQILGFPNRFEDADWDAFFNKNVIGMDVGLCNGKYFLNGMGIGFDAEVAAQNYDSHGNVKPGNANKYVWHIVKTLLLYNAHEFNILANNKAIKLNCFMSTISIGRRFAGKYFITPKAIANDGLLDMCLVNELSLFHRLKLFSQVPTGTHITDKNVSYVQAEKITVEFPRKMPYHIDGELFFDAKFEITLLPKCLRVIYNANGNHYFNV